MVKRSNRTPTLLEHGSEQAAQGTARQLLELLQRGGVKRVTLRHYSQYRSKILSDRGSQFIVYTGDGVNTFNKGEVVVKCSRLRVGNESLPMTDKNRDRAAALYREVQILTHRRITSHPNIPRLLWFDFVDAGDSTFIPALIMERATEGSLSTLLYKKQQSLSESSRIKLCTDITSGLLALHSAGVIHGDVKSENVLVFAWNQEDGGYVAKIADFGSVIIVGAQDGELVGDRPRRYHGTPATNAPEAADQTASKLTIPALRKCDNYSLGLLILEVVVGHLDSAAEAKTTEVLRHALDLVDGRGLSDSTRGKFKSALTQLLQFDPKLRCSDLSIIEHIFRPLAAEDLGVGSLNLDTGTGTASRLRDEEDVADALQSVFGLSDYLDIFMDVEQDIERDTQALVFSRLLESSKSENKAESGKALFQLAIASACGLGTPYGEDGALEKAIAAARKGYLPAQASTVAFHAALGRQDELDHEEQIDWLFEAVAWGSHIATECLRPLSSSQLDQAREAFQRAGGYNQFFYSQEPPSCIHSDEFLTSLSNQEKDLEALAQASAIYGDAALLRRLIEDFGVDPNLTNGAGESLVLLCSKPSMGKRLTQRANSMVLVAGGANPTPDDHKESPLHWLIAFDEDDVEEAAKMLRQNMGELTEETLPDMSWNHPSVDLPGRFPLGSPLHYAIELLISCGALELQPSDRNVLLELGSILTPETWIATAVTGLNREDVAHRCLDIVLSRDETLLDAPGEGGFTPLMGAAQYHDCAVLRAMLHRGCDVNAETPPEYDSRTALNLITENKMQLPADDCTLELLLAAGADLTKHTKRGGKLLLHFAARDDSVAVAEKLLGLGVPGTEVDARMVGYGQTPLHVAAQYGSSRVAALLIDHGADLEAGHAHGTFNAWDWDCLTPMAAAVCMGRPSMVRLLFDRGAFGLARPPSGHTVLHLAVAEPDGGKMLRMLLNLAIPALRTILNAQAGNSGGGVTPLHLAAGNFARAEYVALLLEAAADTNACTDSGHSALDAALALRKRMGRFAEEFERLSLKGSDEELAELLATEADMWESVTMAGGKYSLVMRVGDKDVALQIGLQTRYNYVEGDDDGKEDGVEQDERGNAPVNQCEDDEDDPVLIRFEEKLAELDRSIVELRQAGATTGSTDPVPEGLFKMSCAKVEN